MSENKLLHFSTTISMRERSRSGIKKLLSLNRIYSSLPFNSESVTRLRSDWKLGLLIGDAEMNPELMLLRELLSLNLTNLVN